MKAESKNLQCASSDGMAVTLAEGESFMRRSNLIEATDGNSVKSPDLFPTKFPKSSWIKNGQ